MCCEREVIVPPAPVAAMLDSYRRRDWRDWGEDAFWSPVAHRAFQLGGIEEVTAALRSSSGRSAESRVAVTVDRLESALRDALSGNVPDGCVAVRVTATGVRVEQGRPRPAAVGQPTQVLVLVDSCIDREALVVNGAESVTVAPYGARVVSVRFRWGEDPPPLEVDRTWVNVDGALDVRDAAELTLRAAACARWSVTDTGGWPWFPDGMPEKLDVHGRPYFHAVSAALTVPVGSYHVAVTRGMEFETAKRTVDVAAGSESVVDLEPVRRYDPAAVGWYGGDLHVHLNYGGQHVATPADAARMQAGEGLHLLNLVAANAAASLVWDREALETWVGEDLPWSAEGRVARMGVEYRNDLLGHFHVTGLRGVTGLYHAGHANTDREEDWPPNSVAAAAYRDRGGTVGYCHPVFDEHMLAGLEPGTPTGVLHRVFGRRVPRSFEARELVVDAALGLVNSVDVLSNAEPDGSAQVYRRLLGTGLRLACTAGGDAMLSVRGSGYVSNPPGYVRVYANVSGPLSVAAFTDAVRRGRTVATNGPWLELHVGDRGPGDVLDVAAGTQLDVAARVIGPGVDRLEIRDAAGIVVERQVGAAGEAEVRARVQVRDPTYLVAVASGVAHPDVLHSHVYAHTSGVYVDVDGRSSARAEDVAWCLAWLDKFDALVDTHGVFHTEDHHGDVLSASRLARRYYEERLDP